MFNFLGANAPVGLSFKFCRQLGAVVLVLNVTRIFICIINSFPRIVKGKTLRLIPLFFSPVVPKAMANKTGLNF